MDARSDNIVRTPEGPAEAGPRRPAQRAGRERGVAPGDIVWIFAYPRSGTTWLASMMGDLPHHEMWNEPYVGALFGNCYEAQNGDQQGRSFILGPPLRHAWLPSIRSMVLDGAAARYPQLFQGGYLVIKEPNGCLGSRLLSEALPESRMILMLRDPRDVIASNLDAHRSGSWTAENPRWKDRQKP